MVHVSGTASKNSAPVVLPVGAVNTYCYGSCGKGLDKSLVVVLGNVPKLVDSESVRGGV